MSTYMPHNDPQHYQPQSFYQPLLQQQQYQPQYQLQSQPQQQQQQQGHHHHQQHYFQQHAPASSKPISTSPSSSDQPIVPHFLCLYPSCTAQHRRHADLLRHIHIVHNRATLPLVDCEYNTERHGGAGGGECSRKGARGFTRRDKMIEHMRDVHKCDIPKRKGGGRRGS